MQPPAAPPAQRIAREAAISPAAANLLALPLMAAVALAAGGAFWLLWGWPALRAGLLLGFSPLIFFPVFVLGVLVHEGLHGLGWWRFGRVPWSAIRFGFFWQGLAPYAHCTAPLPAAAYRWGTALPGLVTGVLPVALGLATGAGVVLILGAVLLAAASGDALVLWTIRDVPGQTRVLDHPSKVGCYVLAD
jgi:hypothetical protein